ncbi:MAG: ankyrin repeat domain-containing protein, partial [Desulfobacterales bacterium]|nr:ankyrin repeat domain-containing protein [Desulfobacterales bacterium]
EELLAIAMREDPKEMERFMINHPNFDYLADHGEKGASLIHFIARSGNAKMMNFLLSFIPSSKIEKLVNLERDDAPKTPLNIASRHGKVGIVKVKYTYGGFQILRHIGGGEGGFLGYDEI